MFKKWTILLCVLLFGQSVLFAFGHVGDLFLWKGEVLSPNKHYLGYKFVHQKEITFCTKSSPADWPQPLSNELLTTYFQAAFGEWTHGTAKYLRDSGRKEEFSDVIALLEKPFRLVNLGACTHHMPRKADIEISVAPSFKNSKIAGYYKQYDMRFYSDSQIRIVFPNCQTSQNLSAKRKALVDKYIRDAAQGVFSDDNIDLKKITRDKAFSLELADWKIWDNSKRQYHDQLFTIMLHEVGHAFGLADEAINLTGKQTASGPSKKTGNGERLNEVFRTPYRGYGLMSYNAFYRQRTADDVMGLITILDRYTGTSRIIYPLLSDFAELKWKFLSMDIMYILR